MSQASTNDSSKLESTDPELDDLLDSKIIYLPICIVVCCMSYVFPPYHVKFCDYAIDFT